MSYKTQMPVAEALAILQREARAVALGTLELPLTACYGRTLASNLTAKVAHPSLDNSALDGYACRAADTANASADHPVQLTVTGDVPAGSVFAGEVGIGKAVSIYTGAPVPAGADAIIRVEATERSGDTVTLSEPADMGAIRKRGQDFSVGADLLKKGMRLDAASVAVAAAMGHANLPVVRKPRVGILATGNEIIEPGKAIRDGQVYNSNSYGLTGLVRAGGAEAVVLPNVKDDKEVLETALAETEDLDLLLTSGGVSMGKYDFVRDLLFEDGEVYFWKVNMKPAGPALFGRWQGLPVLGLPGNPVSSLVAFIILARAFIQSALGSSEPLPYHQRQRAITDVPLKSAGFKETFIRLVSRQAEDGRVHVTTTGNQNSGVLTSMLYADALALVPPHTAYGVSEGLEFISLAPYL